MKIGIFTDSHYSSKEVTCSKRLNNQSLRKVQEAYRFFESRHCDVVICLGDLIDTEDTVEKEIENLSLLSEVIRKSPLRTICLMGNHDAFVLTPSRFYSILGTEVPQTLCMDGRTPFCLANGPIGEKCSCKGRASAFFVKMSRFFSPQQADLLR